MGKVVRHEGSTEGCDNGEDRRCDCSKIETGDLKRRRRLGVILRAPWTRLAPARLRRDSSSPDAPSRAGTGRSRAVGRAQGTGEGRHVEVQAFKGGYGIDFYQKRGARSTRRRRSRALTITVDGDPHIWEKTPTALRGRGDPPDLAFPGMEDGPLGARGGGASSPRSDAALDGPPDDGTGKRRRGSSWRDTFEPLAAQARPDGTGKQYVLPYYFSVMGWWYDPGVLQGPRLGRRRRRTTSLLALCPKIKAAGLAPITYQGKYPYYMIEGMLMPWDALRRRREGR